MRTGRFEKLRGFAFSQEEGMKDVVTGKAFGTVVKLRPELELKRIPKAALRDNLRYPKGGLDASGSFNSMMSMSRDHAGSIMDTLGSMRSQSSSSNVRLDQIRSRNASASRRFSSDEPKGSGGPSKKQ